uniref:Uncharacterized protein n=1 Tax=Setaria digitata TaxID=48799 RepID=A0A915PWT1_9BILA
MEEILTNAKEELQESVLNGVSQVIHNDEVLEGMIKLKSLIEGSSKEMKGWRPSGIPSDDVAGHLQPVMTNIERNLSHLKARLEAEIEASNILFIAFVFKKRVCYEETESKAHAMMQEAGFCNHIIRSLP